MITLSDIEKDAFAETFNIGVGRAAASLSEMIGQEVILRIPEVTVANRAEIIALFESMNYDTFSCVSEAFRGEFEGDALLIFPDHSSMELVRLLLNDDIPLEVLSEMEQEALSEVGNIILTGCLASVADIIQEEIPTELPVYSQSDLATIFSAEKDHNTSFLFLKTMFTVQDKEIQGYVTFLMEIDGIHTFKERIMSAMGLAELE